MPSSRRKGRSRRNTLNPKSRIGQDSTINSPILKLKKETRKAGLYCLTIKDLSPKELARIFLLLKSEPSLRPKVATVFEESPVGISWIYANDTELTVKKGISNHTM